MTPLWKNEWRKLCRSWMWWATLAIACGVALFSAVSSIERYRANLDLMEMAAANSTVLRNPQYEAFTFFNSWIGQDFSEMGTSLFFLLLPLFATFPFSWTFLAEEQKGYLKNMLCRTTRRRYFLVKYLMTCLSGAITVAVPMILNVMAVSSFIPAARPDVQFDIYYDMPPGAMASHLFYAHPWGFVVLRVVMAALVAGLLAGCAMALSFYVRNRYAVVLIPFIGLLAMNFVSDATTMKYRVSLSLMYSICGVHSGSARPAVVAAYLIILFAFSFGVTMAKGVRREIL